MNKTVAKSLARQYGFDLWYDRKERVWVLTRSDMNDLGGTLYLSAGTLRALSEDEFTAYLED